MLFCVFRRSDGGCSRRRVRGRKAGALACVGPESQSDRMDVGLFLILALASLVWSWSGVWSGTRRVVGEEIEVSFSFLGQGEVVT